MSTDGITAGWYGDPGGSGGLRWWDGRGWTEHVQPATSPPADGTGHGGFGQQPGSDRGPQGWEVPPAGWPPQQPGLGQGGQASGQGGQPSAWGGHQPGFGGMPPRTNWAANRYSVISAVVSVIYLLLAVSTHLVFIGILPLLMSVRAMRARERLAPVALGLAIVVIVVSIGVLATR